MRPSLGGTRDAGMALGQLHISSWQCKCRGSSERVLFNHLKLTIRTCLLLRIHFFLGHSSGFQGTHKKLSEEEKRAKARFRFLKEGNLV